MNSATDLLESLPLGAESWPAAYAAAEEAIAADLAAAADIVFPEELAPVPTDAIEQYKWLTGRLTAQGYGDALADLHRRALATHGALSAILRSHEAREDVASAAEAFAPRLGQDPAAAAAAGRRRYETAIARQLAAVPGHDLGAAARALLAADDLQVRLAAARAAHEDHAAAERARVEEEQRTAAERARREQAERRTTAARELAEQQAAEAREQSERRRAAGEALAERLRRSGLTQLRVGEGVFSVADLRAAAPGMSDGQIRAFVGALDRALAREARA